MTGAWELIGRIFHNSDAGEEVTIADLPEWVHVRSTSPRTAYRRSWCHASRAFVAYDVMD